MTFQVHEAERLTIEQMRVSSGQPATHVCPPRPGGRLSVSWSGSCRRGATTAAPAPRKVSYRPIGPDIALLAQVDAAHEDLSGPAIRRVLQREYTVFRKAEFEYLAQLSVSPLYNLRRSAPGRRMLHGWAGQGGANAAPSPHTPLPC